MIDRSIVETALEALSVAIGQILEDDHLPAVSLLPRSHQDRVQVFQRLQEVGEDVNALAIAARVLLRRSE